MHLNIIELSESFGVPEAVVEGWIKHEGLPHLADRGRVVFDRAQVAQWAAARGLAAKAGFLAPEHTLFVPRCRLAPLLHPGCVWRDVGPEEAIGCFERVIGSLPALAPAVRQHLARRLRAPGGVTWAPVGEGWAIPHPGDRVSLGRESGALGLIYLRAPLEPPCPPVDGTPITRLLFFLAPSPRAHLDLLGRVSRLLARERPAALLEPAASDDAIREALAASDAASAANGGKTEGRA